jgi:protein TonB
MADVLIVCVREDEPQAKALAEMFEAAGFSIGGAPSSDAALRSSGAGLVVWSQASIRSRPFLDAAQRVINAQKAVVASLIEPPPPSSIGDSAVFDLSHWDGDPNDPTLDPLFFAVDRMVNSARTSVGAEREETVAYEAPREAPPPPRVAPRAPPPPPQQNLFTRTSRDSLGTEAEHWRAIRDSRDPADFMDYLARYGPDGAFSEVAELRLKQLTARGEARPTPPRATPAPKPAPRQAPRAQARAETPAPARRPDPPTVRRPESPRRLERSYERSDLRDPPKEGGALRAFILIAVLGAAALGGGLYFGGGIPDFAAAPPAAVESTESSAPFADSGPLLDEPAGVPIEDLAEPPRPVEVAARREPTPPAPAPAREEPRPETPAPVASWSGEAGGTGGPLSLRPNEQASNAPSTVVALTPPATGGSTAASAAVPTTPPRPTPSAAVVWAQRPSARRISELYPARALREGLGGRVELDCSVRANLSLACGVATESPSGLGFGRAALGASSSYRARSTMSDGSEAIGARTRIVVQFLAPPQ